MSVFIVLAREMQVPAGVAIELEELGAIDPSHLQLLASIAKTEGFNMMYEFNSRPDIAEVGRLAPEGKVSGMASMTRLWLLQDAHGIQSI